MGSNLTAFQRDLLFVITSVGPAKGLAVKDELSDYYAKEINHGQLYPNLDTLVDRGLVEKGSMDRRTTEKLHIVSLTWVYDARSHGRSTADE